jgi:serine O-acetyltransferase
MARCIRTLREDIRVIMERDPAARNTAEILLCYPGLHALLIYRISHLLWIHGLKLAGRLLSQIGRFLTGIEIHPGATIGRRFFIDHGMGVVVGETSVIGDDVTLYQGVTLGGKSWKKEKRHPDLDDHVVVGAGTKIIGPCVIGNHTRIGANSVVVRNVPPRSTVVGVPGRIILSQEGEPHEEVNLEHHLLPDPEEEAIQFLIKKVRALEKKLKEHEELLAEVTAGQAEPRPQAAKK